MVPENNYCAIILLFFVGFGVEYNKPICFELINIGLIH